jgi:pyruvate-formate lyase
LARRPEVASFADFEAFWSAFEQQVQWLAGVAVRIDTHLWSIHRKYYPTPILSALFEGPMSSGQDVTNHGATLSTTGTTVVGFADVVDSLAAIRRVVFEEQVVTFTDLRMALESNFRGYEHLQARLADPRRTPKYGNDDPATDALAGRVVELLDRVMASFPREQYPAAPYRMGYWTMTSHAGLGWLTGALPNGRGSGESFASGITPVSGATGSLLPALNSVASLPSSCLTNGVALNLKFTPWMPADEDGMLQHLAAVVKGYFAPRPSGSRGMEIQFNVTSRETLEQLQQDPERWPHLLVRVSGYTAYFQDLNVQMQNEIIERAEYSLASGRVRHQQEFKLPGGGENSCE